VWCDVEGDRRRRPGAELVDQREVEGDAEAIQAVPAQMVEEAVEGLDVVELEAVDRQRSARVHLLRQDDETGGVGHALRAARAERDLLGRRQGVERDAGISQDRAVERGADVVVCREAGDALPEGGDAPVAGPPEVVLKPQVEWR
jgi:hypothetical protein